MTLWQRVTCGWIGLAVIGMGLSVQAAEPSHTISIPVALRSRMAAGTGATAPATSARPLTPTTPSGKLPQYQLEREPSQPLPQETLDPRDSQPDIWRCRLHLSQRSILVEIAVMVDGQPYQQVRQGRIARALRALRADANRTVESRSDDVTTPVSAEAAMTAATKRVVNSEEILTQRLHRYSSATGRQPTEQEVGWLITHTIDGPACLWMNDHFQQVRGEQRPEFLVLDRDGNGVISAAELARVADTFLSCDTNRNDIIEWKEIAAAAQRPQPRTASTASPSVLTPATDDHAPPDLKLLVEFDRSAPQQSRLTVTAVSPDLQASMATAQPGRSGLHLKLLGTPVVLQAVQSADPDVDQLAVGAIRDGYPWLPELDEYDDGRITLRELRDLLPRLKRFDTNGDDELTEDEAVSPVRLCLAWGPIVHQELANLRQVGVPPDSWNVTGPEWFVRMDRNRDRDLTRGEFPGTDEQFTSMDRDQDTLISVDEALRFEAGTNDNSQP